MNNPFGNKIGSLLSSDRMANLIKYSNACPRQGYFLEAGVYQGGSLEVLTRFNPDVEVIAIDSFEGVPEATPEKDFHRLGDFNEVDFHAMAGYFKMIYPRVRIVKAFIPKAFDFFDDNARFSFCHIDLDMYQSIKDSLDFCLPRMLEGGMILLDDYNQRSTPGCKLAIDDFFEESSLEVSHRGELKYWEAENAKTHYQYLIVK